jgi:hypothetical protein
MFDPIFIWKDQAVSSTTVYRSRVLSPPPGLRLHTQIELTGAGAAGKLVGQVNNLPAAQYNAAVAAAGSEAANTTGWRTVNFKDTDVPTTAVAAAGDVDLLVGTLDGVAINTPPGAFRYRFQYTNSGAAGVLNGYSRYT